MEQPALAQRPWTARQLILPVAAAAGVVACLVAVIIAARQTGGGGAPQEPGPMAMPAGAGYAAFTVERAEAGRLAVSGGTGASELTVPPGTRVWVLEPAGPGDIRPGMQAAVIGVPNEVRNAAIRAIVVGEGGTAGATAGPFAGHEALGEAAALPLVTGRVERVEAGRMVLATAAGEAAVWFAEGAPLFAARERTGEAIGPGDRVGVLLDAAGQPDPAAGLLVLPGD